MKRKTYVLLAALVAVMVIGAYAIVAANNNDARSSKMFVVDGLKYSVKSDNAVTTQVVGYEGDVKDLIIPNQVTYQDRVLKVDSIGKSAFEGCRTIVSLKMPDDLDSIGKNAFSKCISLKTVEIGNNTKSLGAGAFSNCTGLTDLTLPVNLNTMVKSTDPAFKGCEGIYTVTLTKGTGHGHAYEDNTYTPWHISKNTFRLLIISKGVESIGDNTFKNCPYLSALTLPDSVTKIGKAAFKGCSLMTSMMFSEGLTSIGDYAFEGCQYITSLTLPDTVSELGKSTFKDCTRLLKLNVPVNLNTVADDSEPAFKGCEMIKTFNLTKGTGHGHDYGDNTYAPWNISKASSKIVTVSDGVTTIGDNTFKECKGLIQITLPHGITEIGKSAFEGCKDLTAIDLKTVSSLGDYAFKNCRSIERLSIPTTAKQIGEECFRFCTALNRLTLPENMTHISDGCFRGCGSLETLTIPDSVVDGGKNSFAECMRLKNVVMPISMDFAHRDGINKYPMFKGCIKIENIILTQGNGTAYDIPEDPIGGFGDVLGLDAPWRISKSLETITIAEGITKIGERYFENMRGNLQIKIPRTLNTIGANAFDGIGIYDTNSTTPLEPTPENLRGCTFVLSGNTLIKHIEH